MAEVIRVDYEVLQQIADKFGRQSEVVAAVQQAVRSAMDPLEGGGWEGRGSDAFFNEMNSDILPAVQRLNDALTQAQAVSKQIHNLMQQAEDEASASFKGESGGGSGALGGLGAGIGGLGSAIGAVLGRAFSLGSAGAGGAWGSGGFNPAGLSRTFDNILGGSGFGGGLSGGPLGSGFPGGTGSEFGGNDFGIPREWLSGVTDSLNGYMGSNYNDYGIPRDWLNDVSSAFGGSGNGNDYGIPKDWLDGVSDSFSSDSGGGSAGSGSGGGTDSGSGSGGGLAGGGSPSGSGGGSGGGSGPQTDISDPFRGGVPRDFRSVGSATGSGETGAGAAGRLSYQSLGGMAGGGSSAPAAPAGPAAFSSGGGAAPAAAAGNQGNMGVPFGIAAASPFLALLGKAIKSKVDDD
jgi:WXG100 family type VII secretion target